MRTPPILWQATLLYSSRLRWVSNPARRRTSDTPPCASLLSRRHRRLSFLLVGILPLSLSAQGSPPPSEPVIAGKAPRLTCFRGQPLPACKRFVLTELGVVRRVSGTTTQAVGFDGVPIPGQSDKDFSNEPLAEFGMMQNVSVRNAIGGVLVLWPDVGAKARYRRWLDSSGVSLDVGLGMVRRTTDPMRSAALVSDVALNFSDYGALVLRAQTAAARGHRAVGVQAGVRLGSKPALIGGGVLAVLFGIFAAAWSGAWNE